MLKQILKQFLVSFLKERMAEKASHKVLDTFEENKKVIFLSYTCFSIIVISISLALFSGLYAGINYYLIPNSVPMALFVSSLITLVISSMIVLVFVFKLKREISEEQSLQRKRLEEPNIFQPLLDQLALERKRFNNLS